MKRISSKSYSAICILKYKIIFRKICLIFDIENWLWKLPFCNFWEVRRSWKKFLSKIGHHIILDRKNLFKIEISITKIFLLDWWSKWKKNRKNSDDFWHWKLTLKIRFWHFLTAIFGHLTSLMKKSNPFLWSVQSYLQSEMFLSNSVDMMKNLLLFQIRVSKVVKIWKTFLVGLNWLSRAERPKWRWN